MTGQEQPPFAPERTRQHARRGHRHRHGHHGRPGADDACPNPHRRHGRLYKQIFKAFLLMVLTSAAIAAVLGHLFMRSHRHQGQAFVRGAAEMLVDSIPKDERAPAVLQRRGSQLSLAISMWAPDGTLIGHSGVAHPPPRPSEPDFAWSGGDDDGLRIRLPDGHFVATSEAPNPAGLPRLFRFLLSFALLLGVLSLFSYALSRRITRRLERLQAGVERFGQGQLQSRVSVVGNDEVSELALSFNAAAARIEALVQQQQRMLASASHELRAPLTRLRMALSLVLEDDVAPPSPARRAELLADAERDIEELDQLVDDVLLAARMQAETQGPPLSPTDLTALCQTLCARFGVPLSGTAPVVLGEAKKLQRLLRNLLDNAHKHGGGTDVTVELATADDGAALVRVCDRGPGVAEADRERIFEAFYRPQGHAETRDGGVGLGLSLVHAITEVHGAVMSLDDGPGAVDGAGPGLRVALTFPKRKA